MDIKTRTFVYLLAPDCRLRHLHRRAGKTIVSFAVQLEVWHPRRSVWMPVVRYDTAHGFAHREWLHADGSIEKMPLPVGDYQQTLQYAEADLKDHWELYRKRFMEELTHDQ